MSFGIFTKGQNESLDYAQQHLAQDLPLEFGEAFDAAWREGLLFGQSISASTSRMQGVQDYLDGIREKTGTVLTNPAFGGGSAALDELNGQLTALAPKFPDLGLKPLTSEDLDRLGEEKARRARQVYRKAAGREQTWGGTAGLVLGSLSAGAADPVNIITLPLAAPKALGILGTALATAGITAGTQVGIEAVAAPFKERVEPGYGASGEAGENVLNAAIAGGVLGGGAKALGALWTRYHTGSWPRSVRDAGNVVASEGQIDATNPVPTVEGEVAHRTALQQAIDGLVSGRPVEVSETITPDLLRAYGARLDPVLEARANARAAQESAFALEREGARLPASMERLSELQLSEIRGTALAMDRESADAFASLRSEADSLSARRTALDGRAPERDGLRSEVDGLRSDLTAIERRLAEARTPSDPGSQARLAAIESDLAAEALPAARRSELEAERTTITETLTATAPADARAMASLEAEAKGLRVALSRKEKALARAEATDARARAALDRADGDLPSRITAHEQRAAGRREAVTTEMRRTVARLAQDGYGVRLSREEAEQIAGRILAAGDENADTVLRSVTEHLVDRALEQRRAQPAAAPGVGRPDPVGEQRARIGHWTEQTRKRIQGLAREVGYDMPRDEAAAIAAAVAHVRTDDEALALLDEVMLRPRTVVETLPGTLAARRLEEADYRRSAAARAVRDDVFRQLVAAGVPEEEAAAHSAIWGARYHARARRLGLDPSQAFDLYQKEGVDIRAAEAPDVLGPDTLAQLAGERAKTADVATFSEARQMEAEGASSSDIWLATGWARGFDKKWRFEISDTEAQVRSDGLRRLKKGDPVLLRDLYDHPKLEAAYPQIFDYRVFPAGEASDFGGAVGTDSATGAPIMMVSRDQFDSQFALRKILVHEIQHWIQDIEEFHGGSNPAANQAAAVRPLRVQMADLVKEFEGGALDTPAKLAAYREYERLAGEIQAIKARPASEWHDSYMRGSGEVEARNAARREGLSDESLAVIPPRETEDLPRSEQIVPPPASMFFSPAEGAPARWKEIPVGDDLVARGSVRRGAGGSDVVAFDLFRRPSDGAGLPDGVKGALGQVELLRRNDGRWEVDWSRVPESERGKGYASRLYDVVEKELGANMVPSGMLLPDGHAFWQARNPDLVQWHRKVGKAWYSPRRMEEELAGLRAQEAADPGSTGTRIQAFETALDSVPPEGKTPEAMARMFQDETAPRGAITMAENRALIELFQGRDASTFMHESGHLWLTEMVRDAKVSPEVKADLDATLRWLGVDDAAKIGVEHQEKWARGFEQYLRDGKAPTTALARVFEQFRDWLTSIYRAVSDLGDELPEEIRGVMDRLLAVPEGEGAIGARNQMEANRTGSRGSRVPEPIGQTQARGLAGAAQASAADGGVPFGSRGGVTREQLAALAPEFTPAKLLVARSSEETEAAVLHDLDKLRATRDLQIPVGERLDETGQRVADMRSVDDLMDEANARLAAAAEIRACAMPMPEVTP